MSCCEGHPRDHSILLSGGDSELKLNPEVRKRGKREATSQQGPNLLPSALSVPKSCTQSQRWPSSVTITGPASGPGHEVSLCG